MTSDQALRGRKFTRLSALTFVVALRTMMAGPASAVDIAAATGLHLDTVRHLLNAMCRDGVAHECGRAPDSLGRMTVRVFSLGSAEAPLSISSSQH